MKFISILLFVVFSSVTTAIAQQPTYVAKVLFRDGSCWIDESYGDNEQILCALTSYLRQITPPQAIHSITLEAFTSPTGQFSSNQDLAQRRLRAIERYLNDRLYLPDCCVQKTNGGIGYAQLRDLVAASQMEYRDEVIDILDYTPEFIYDDHHRWVDGCKHQLMSVRGGQAWNYMEQEFFPKLRNITIHIQLCAPQAQPASESISESASQANCERMALVAGLNLGAHAETDTEPTPECTVVEEQIPVPIEPVASVVSPVACPVLAFKTNLLYDAASALNLEIEVPIGRRWSIAGEFIFPWWKSHANDLTFQLLTGNLEVRFWLGNRHRRDVLTGWNVGLYAGGGLFDMQLFDPKGVQGEFFIATGLSVGFAHPIGRSLRLEYSVGVGYMQTNYKEYTVEHGTSYGDIKVWKYPWQTSRNRWIGPTKAKISLVWLIRDRYRNCNKRGATQ
ncbi:MAG: DUF3575 domain-containing protein [Alistipes sp.]